MQKGRQSNSKNIRCYRWWLSHSAGCHLSQHAVASMPLQTVAPHTIVMLALEVQNGDHCHAFPRVTNGDDAVRSTAQHTSGTAREAVHPELNTTRHMLAAAHSVTHGLPAGLLLSLRQHPPLCRCPRNTHQLGGSRGVDPLNMHGYSRRRTCILACRAGTDAPRLPRRIAVAAPSLP